VWDPYNFNYMPDSWVWTCIYAMQFLFREPLWFWVFPWGGHYAVLKALAAGQKSLHCLTLGQLELITLYHKNDIMYSSAILHSLGYTSVYIFILYDIFTRPEQVSLSCLFIQGTIIVPCFSLGRWLNRVLFLIHQPNLEIVEDSTKEMTLYLPIQSMPTWEGLLASCSATCPCWG
jgi:hypothetical protein